MEKIDNIKSLRLIKNKCLIEIEHEQYNKETNSGIILGDEAYNKEIHAIRYGILTRMPNTINMEYWKTDYFPDEGDEVWYDFTVTKDATRVKCKHKIYIVLGYESLYIARSPKKGVRPLNGYLLAQKALKRASGMYNGIEQLHDEYYDDIYDIKYAGKPNLSYKDDRYVDDKSITEGMRVMTRASNYPILEEKMYWKFSEETYYLMQRKDIIGKVEEL